MRTLLIVAAASLLATPAVAQSFCAALSGAVIVANDGQFLGFIASPYDPDSILNEYGTHGSQYSGESIWNEYGTYGGKYASLSPFNPYTSTPPMIVMGGSPVGYLTVANIANAVNPFALKTCQ